MLERMDQKQKEDVVGVCDCGGGSADTDHCHLGCL